MAILPRTKRALVLAALLTIPGLCLAHFQELIPSRAAVEDKTEGNLSLDIQFTHPMMGGPRMNMDRPVRFGVMGPQGKQDLSDALISRIEEGKQFFSVHYAIDQPGDHIFYLEPAPYWEPAEDVMIIHYTKVVVAAFGGEENWDGVVGFPVEINPLVRPYGLWAGNLFQGTVTRDGEPVPFATVEVEWRNDGSFTVPADPFVTQIIRADANGTFSYAMPRAGWWVFAALLPGETPIPNPVGDDVEVEYGALIWVQATDMH